MIAFIDSLNGDKASTEVIPLVEYVDELLETISFREVVNMYRIDQYIKVLNPTTEESYIYQVVTMKIGKDYCDYTLERCV